MAALEGVPPVPEYTVQVKTLAGSVLAEVVPVPRTTRLLKEALWVQVGRPVALQKIVMCDSFSILEDDEELPQQPLEVVCLTDESPLWSWDLHGNSAKDQLQVDGPRVTCPGLKSDYVNVITKAPMVSGRHYIEFVMHHIGDEQWCGVLADPLQAGSRVGGRRMTAWTYYCGRMGSRSSNLVDGQGALHAQGKAVARFEKLQRNGDVIGMLVDIDAGAIAFDRNGKLQVACPIPKGTPLWVLTVVDTNRDDVELRKPSLDDAPPKNMESLTGALLDITQGKPLSRAVFFSDDDSEEEVF